MNDVLCPRHRCPAAIGGMLARWDGVHFTGRFSRRIVPIILARAERAGIALSR